MNACSASSTSGSIGGGSYSASIFFQAALPEEAQRRFPLIDLEGVVGAAFVTGDGYIDPAALAQGFATRARRSGVRIVEGVTVSGAENEKKGLPAKEALELVLSLAKKAGATN